MPQRYARRPLRVAVGALALIATLVLSACAPSGPDIIPLTVEPSTSSGAADTTPTATPLIIEPYVTPAPQSTSEAIRYASGALQNYFDVALEVMGSPSDAAPLEVLAAGDALDEDLAAAAALAENGATLGGIVSFTADVGASFVQPLIEAETGNVIAEFANVTIQGCRDMSRVTGTNGDGSPMRIDPNSRTTVTAVLIFAPSDSSWMVFQMGKTNGEVIPC